MKEAHFLQRYWLASTCLLVVLILPLIDAHLPSSLRVASLCVPVMIYAIIGLGLNVVSGFTGLLNLGSAAFMAIGAYAFSILTCPIYPFALGFWSALGAAMIVGMLTGLVLGLPTMRLRGDYLAIVTLGFGEITKDVLINLDAITKGTQGLNPVAPAALPGLPFPTFAQDYRYWYYLILALLLLAVWLCTALRLSGVGRAWVAVREDTLAARCMGVLTARVKLGALAFGAALCAAGGAIFASLSGTSVEPAFYDFQRSVIILCIVIVGGLGSIRGVLLGALIMVGFNSIILTKVTEAINRAGVDSSYVFAKPDNWKYLIFGIALILMMRLKPEGLLPARDIQAELHRQRGPA